MSLRDVIAVDKSAWLSECLLANHACNYKTFKGMTAWHYLSSTSINDLQLSWLCRRCQVE